MTTISTEVPTTGPAYRTTPLSPEDVRQEGWSRANTILAVAGVVIIALRLPLPKLLTVGDVMALGLLPIWYPVARRYASARLLMLLGLFCIPVGVLLTLHSSVDHSVSRGNLVSASFWMLGVVASIGFLLWARERIGSANLAVAFGIGLLLSINPSSNLFPSNPWKFGFAVPITVLALALAHRSGKRWLELVLALVLTVVCFFTDARSSFGILLLTATLMAWQLRPTARNRKGSAIRVLLGLSTVLVSIYYVGQALIIGGAFGAATRDRTISQLHEAGSLILGGRPEVLASIRLIQDNPWGPGAGTIPNYHEVAVAKAGMAQINYDPNNGYVENWMFGNGYSLHSMFGDLWAQWGLVGLLFTAVVFAVVLRRLAFGVSEGTATAVILYLTCLTLWNVFFAPWYSGLRLLELLVALILIRRAAPSLGETSKDLQHQVA